MQNLDKGIFLFIIFSMIAYLLINMLVITSEFICNKVESVSQFVSSKKEPSFTYTQPTYPIYTENVHGNESQNITNPISDPIYKDEIYDKIGTEIMTLSKQSFQEPFQESQSQKDIREESVTSHARVTVTKVVLKDFSDDSYDKECIEQSEMEYFKNEYRKILNRFTYREILLIESGKKNPFDQDSDDLFIHDILNRSNNLKKNHPECRK